MKFADQTGITELITLTKTALKPLEAFKNSVTDVNGIVKSNGSGGFSAAVAGTDYAAASHTHDYLPLTGGKLTGKLTVGGALGPSMDTDGTIVGQKLKIRDPAHEGGNFATINSDGLICYRNSVEVRSDIAAAPANHTHDYLPLSGGTLTGNLTGKYITGTWLQTTATGDKAGNFATIDGDGWIYYRTPAEVVTDLDLPNNTTIRASTSEYGITKLSNSTTSTSTSLAATPKAVKNALDAAKAYTDAAITSAINSAY